MSMATWKEEFFGDLKRAQKSNLAAIRHGIRKWEGLRKENREAHDVRLDWARDLVDQDGTNGLELTSSSCALCLLYIDKGGEHGCRGCPLRDVRGVPCDEEMEMEGLNEAPWHVWSGTQNPIPMIDWLHIAERFEKAKLKAGK